MLINVFGMWSWLQPLCLNIMMNSSIPIFTTNFIEKENKHRFFEYIHQQENSIFVKENLLYN